MMWLFAILAVLLRGGVAVVAAGMGTPLAQEYDDRPDAEVPADRPRLQQREPRVVDHVPDNGLTAESELVEDHPFAGDGRPVIALQEDLDLQKAAIDM